MTLEELYGILCKTTYPVAYESHKLPVSLPCITFEENGRDNILADDRIYMHYKNIRISLYTSEKDISAEENLEKILDDAEMVYEYYDIGCVNDEKVHEVDYEIRIQEERE